MNTLEKEFVPYQESLELKELGFDEPCFGWWFADEEMLIIEKSKKSTSENIIQAPTFSQAVNFLYICSNKQIDIELKASDTYEERIRKITKGCEDLRNIQNNKSN